MERKFVLSVVEMRASGRSGKHFMLHQPTEKDLRKQHKEYCQNFFVGEGSSADCEYIKTVSTPTPVKEFCPIDKKWQTEKCSQLGVELISSIPSKPKQKMTISSKPETIVEVVPDGNCFFRSICYWLTGAMDQHHNIRSAFMKEKWSEQGKQIVGKDYENYIKKFRMNEEGTWATENEIFATADLLETTIMIFTKGTKEYEWVTHNPSIPDRVNSVKKLYLKNECNHYEPVTKLSK